MTETRDQDGSSAGATRSRGARSSVFASKLRPALNPRHLLPRARLHALLDESLETSLTLVIAPAGSGKTALLACWVAQAAIPYAWLSLDDADRDPVQFWSGVFQALEGIAPGCSTAGARILRRPDGVLEAVGAVLDDLESRDLDTRVLVVDDLQLVDDVERIAGSFALFVQHLPRWLRVVVASRHDSRLPVHRLRARGQVVEVHFAELRFTFDEAVAMLARLAPTLGSDAVNDVAARAGGWAASIQLAALAARTARAQDSPQLPQPTGDRHQLQDYVWEEVLAQESDAVVGVLIATSVVERVDPDLARVLAARTDAPDLLAQAEARGLFVSRIEPSGCYEMHGLVREVLLAMLAERSPDRLPGLHASAAGWYEMQGETISALDHWLRAEQPVEALRLLSAQAAMLSDGGHESTILRTIDAIPESVATGSLASMLDFAWCHLLVDRRRFTSIVDYVARSTRQDLEVEPVLAARLDVLQSMASTLRGHWVDGASLARAALDGLGDAWWLDPLGQFSYNMIARDIALSERWDDGAPEVREVIRALDVAPERRLALEGTRALGEALSGRPVDALRVAAGTRRVAELENLTILRTEILVAEAIAHRELGDLPEALAILTELADGRIEPAPHCQLLARIELSEARLDEGNLEAARRAFGLAAELVDTELYGPGARAWLARTGVRLDLADGDLDGARSWASQIRDPFWGPVSAARILIDGGDRAGAIDALKAAEPRCVRHRVLADVLEARCTDEQARADALLEGAVRVASTHNLVQTVASEGAEVVEAIERLAWPAPQTWLDRLRRACVPQGTATAASVDGWPVEALTDRELEVLRMLPSRLTLREIADELFISINTLKFHLKVIYRKLGCASRAEAAEVARTLTSLRRPPQSSSTRRR